MSRRLFGSWIVALVFSMAGLWVATAEQGPIRQDQNEPCCSITAINLTTGVVNATETDTGRTFQFTVKDAAVRKTLTVDQAIHANFKKMKVSVRPDVVAPCCAVVNLRLPVNVLNLKGPAKAPGKAEPRAVKPGEGDPRAKKIDWNCVEAEKLKCRTDCLHKFFGPGNTAERNHCYDICDSKAPEGGPCAK